MADDYKSLCAIEKAMENTISFVSFENERFSDYVKDMSRCRDSDAGCLKLLMMYENQFKKRRKSRAAKWCGLEMEAIRQARLHPRLRKYYPQIDFSAELPEPVVQRLKNVSRMYTSQYDRLWILWLLATTVVCCLLLALLVLLLRLPFMAAEILCLLLMAASFCCAWYGGIYHLLQMGIQKEEGRFDPLLAAFLRHIHSG